MALLSPDQRNALFIDAAERTGIHKPILAALYQVQKKPNLADGETGLGVAPANRIALDQVNTFAKQVQYAANTIRSLTNRLTIAGWKPADFWLPAEGRYSDKFLRSIATGYHPPTNDPLAAILETCNPEQLFQAYFADFKIDLGIAGVSSELNYLDTALKTLVDQIPRHYLGLLHQRTALLEMVRLWHKLDNREQAIATLRKDASDSLPIDESVIDPVLLQQSQQIAQTYSGYPHQREALLRLTQLWQHLESREATIAFLQTNPSLALQLTLLDPALIALVQQISQTYRGLGEQRNALVEGFRSWQQLETRSAALIALGVKPDIFTATNTTQDELTSAAIQVDRALLDFIQWVPSSYEGADYQREALLHLTQLWRKLETRDQTIQSLVGDLKRASTANRHSPEAVPAPVPIALPLPPETWTPNNVQLHATIVASGSFTWAEATRGGIHLPANQATVDAIVRVAILAQQARDRLGRPMHVVRWYSPTHFNGRAGNIAYEQHSIGHAIAFYCDGLSGAQLYWFLDPWWPGGLGRYSIYSPLCYIDARPQRARWVK